MIGLDPAKIRQALEEIPNPDHLTVECLQNEGQRSNQLFLGDNLQVLSLLQRSHTETIKLIYLDPPYNTGKQFVYDDSETKENWEKNILQRLHLSRPLLRSDGVLLFSIDDHEVHRARLLCDHVLGAKNFVCTFVWQRSGAGGLRGKFPVLIHEYILCYAKDKSAIAEEWKVGYSEAAARAFRHEDTNGRYKTQALYLTSLKQSKTQSYPIELPDGTFAVPPKTKGAWRFVRSQYERAVADDKIHFLKTTSSPLLLPDGTRAAYNIYTKQYIDPQGSNPSTILPERVGRTRTARSHLRKFFDDDVFEYAKPVDLLEHLIEMIQVTDGDVILDPYAGSGTTVEAIMNLVKRKKCSLSWLAIQKPTPLKKTHPLRKRGFTTIGDIIRHRINTVHQHLFPEQPLQHAVLHCTPTVNSFESPPHDT